MILVTEENKDQINSALTAKLLDFDINIPSILNDIKLLDLDKLNDASADVSNKLNVDTWFNNTIACMDISAGCQGCNETQTDFGECKGGCFGINTGCSDCQDTDAVPVCTSCDNGETCEQTPTIIEVCTSCDEGCFVCDSACFRCDGGCQGGQTCHSCNNGEGCTTGCENNFHAGCSNCELDFQLCATGYIPPCNRSQAKYGCASCDAGCQGGNVCETGYAARDCEKIYNTGSEGCTNSDGYIEKRGCTSGNIGCSYILLGGDCRGDFSEGNYTTTCTSYYKWSKIGTGTTTCSSGYARERDGLSCKSNYTSDEDDIKCNSSYSTSSGHTIDHCENFFSINITGEGSCSGIYSKGSDGTDCYTSFSNGSGTSCASVFASSSSDNDVSCRSRYVSGTTTCEGRYAGDTSGTTCTANFKVGDITCNSGYTTMGGNVCVSGYSKTSAGISCPSNYGNTCDACNVGSNNVCVDCDNGEAAQCTRCYGNGNEANCQSGCVLGQADTCDANCVTVGNGGCNDCQGCDSGCNNNVSCDSTFRYDENGKIDCKVTYTDTSCGQTCVNGFNSNTDCFSCVSCDSDCESCEASCQGGCQSCESGCQTYCEAVCQSCEGGCDATCDTSCYGGCNTCDGTCDINCENCQGECIIGVGECSSNDGCVAGEAICAGAWCGSSQGCEGGF